MDRKKNKKGFTIVELAAVIAIIAILAAVMIFTFSGMAKKAKESDISERAKTVYKSLMTEDEYKELEYIDLNSEKGAVDLYIKVDYENREYYFKVIDGSVSAAEDINEIPDGYTSKTGDYANVFVFTDNGEG